MARGAIALGLALSAVLATSCRTDDPGEAVRAFDHAAESGARSEVYALLGPATRARLVADAQRAGEISGRRGVRPEELLAIGWSPRRFRGVDVEVVSRAGDHAEVEVKGAHGEREVLSLVREAGAWRIELP